ncbi:hypothetical protein EAS68_13085 [Legionella jordanis]|uniref:hypothetical protein n=1 Tax=Legionella jordanis TaxID=456 RepID=UPI000EFE9D2E|nr:hypothetical protein [Legionella jordanis]RMX15116.1 hypothetical protein EAS68_13085 [Legionella jordanis]
MAALSLVKHGFFNKSPSNLKEFSYKEDDFNLSNLRLEFSTLYQLFLANKRNLSADGELIAYLDYLSDLLIRYYEFDFVRKDLKHYLKKKKELTQFNKEETDTPKEQKEQAKSSSSLMDELKKKASHLALAFTSSAQFRKYLCSVIATRSYWNYSRALATYLILFELNSNLADWGKEICDLTGIYYSPYDFIQLLDKPQQFLRVSSVALYFLRFTGHFLTILKHLIEAVNSKELSIKKVLFQEIEKRIYIMANDIIWGTVNLLSHYNQFFDISALVIAQINLFFLGIDILLFGLRWFIEEKNHRQMFSELSRRQNKLEESLELQVINRQLNVLADELEVQYAFYSYNIAAAILLLAAFGATLMLSGPVALGCLAALNMLGNALYNSCEEYKQYKKACVAFKRESLNGELLGDERHQLLLSQLEYERKRTQGVFWKTLIFNAGFTAFLITAAAISWPVACVLTLSYLVYRVKTNYDDHQKRSYEQKNQSSHEIYRFMPQIPSRLSVDNADSRTTPSIL